MCMEVEFEVVGLYALFSDPVTRVGGERQSYQVPTYEALKGIAKSIYWKPTLNYEIEAVRVMNPIRYETKGIKLPNYHNGENDLADFLYLKDVRYQVKARMVWNLNRPEYARDRKACKHLDMFCHALAKGGRRDVCLGARECQADAYPAAFGSGQGAYDDVCEIALGTMYHGITYPDEGYDDETRQSMYVNFWQPVMRRGEIIFIKPSECKLKKKVRSMPMKHFPLKEEKE